MTDSKYPGFLSVKEFAARNGISEHLVEKCVRENTLPHARLGRRILIPADALDQLLSENGWVRKGV